METKRRINDSVFKTTEELINYRNKILMRQASRAKHFKSDKPNYYDLRINELNQAIVDKFPEYNELVKTGRLIKLKK